MSLDRAKGSSGFSEPSHGVWTGRGTQPLQMGEKQTKEQPPIPVLEGRAGAEPGKRSACCH